MTEDTIYIEELPKTDEDLDAIAEDLLSHGESIRVKRIREPRKKGRDSQTVVYVAHSKMVTDVLRDDKTFHLEHYDRALKHHTFLLTSDEREYAIRQSILRLALRHDEHRARHDDLDMNVIAKSVTESIVASLKQKHAETKRFDLVREYGFMVSYLTSAQAFGVRGPSSSPIVAHALRFFRSRATGRPFKLTRESRPMDNMLCATQAMVGQLFANFENRQRLMAFIGGQGAKHMRRAISKARKRHAQEAAAGTLTFLLEGVRAEAEQKEIRGDDFDRNVEGILFEFVGTMVLLVGAAFPRMVAVMEREGLTFQDLAKQLETPDEEFGVINELMRLDSPTRPLLRQVRKNTELHGVKLYKDEFVRVLIPHANLDPNAFECPHQYTPQRTDQMQNVHFGPWGGPHACRAPNWTCEIIRQLFLQTNAFPNLRFVDGEEGRPKAFQGNIDSWLVEFD